MGSAVPASSFRLRSALPIALTLAAALAALGLGLLVGYPTGEGLLVLAAGGLVLLIAVVSQWPAAGLLVLVASVFHLWAYAVTEHRGVNPIDLLLPPVLVAFMFGRTRMMALHGDRLERGVAHDAIRDAGSGLARSVSLYFGVAALSLVLVAMRGRPDHAIDSGLVLGRGLAGAALFPLAMWWTRSEQRLQWVIRAMFAGGVVFACVNLIGVFAWGVKRAGLTWAINQPEGPIQGPNEGALAMLTLWAILMARQSFRPHVGNLLAMGGVFFMLILTQSRSGLLAWITFVLLTSRPRRLVYGIGGLLALAPLIPLIPGDFWIRMTRTLTLQRGSFEAFSIIVRFYGYRAAWDAFLDQPLIGIGYLGFRFVSDRYNELRFVMITAENFFLETAVGLGVVGLALVAVVFWRLFRIGAVVVREVPEDSFAHHLAHLNTAFIASLIVANLTADNLIGMVSIGQLAIWCALLLRSGHLALTRQAAP